MSYEPKSTDLSCHCETADICVYVYVHHLIIVVVAAVVTTFLPNKVSPTLEVWNVGTMRVIVLVCWEI